AGPGLSGFQPKEADEDDQRVWKVVEAARDVGPDRATDLWLKDDYMAPAMEQQRLAPRLRKMARENAHSWLHNPLLQRFPKGVATEGLKKIQKPILLILGSRDVPLIKLIVHKLEKELSKKPQRKDIPNAGHMVNMENVEEFNQALLTFLEKVK